MIDQASYDQFRERLARLLREPSPAYNAQRLMAPELSYGRHGGPPAHDARNAAVLVLLYPRENVWRIPMTLRPTHMSEHAGQVSFPGGSAEPGETAEETAVREMEEELGLDAQLPDLLGRLSELYVYGTNYRVTPCVATIPSVPKFTPSPIEVERVVDLSAPGLLDKARHGVHAIQRRGVQFQAPHVLCDGYHIWGATCMILAELATLLERATKQ